MSYKSNNKNRNYQKQETTINHTSDSDKTLLAVGGILLLVGGIAGIAYAIGSKGREDLGGYGFLKAFD